MASKAILLSGWPGSGKTDFAQWLARCGWIAIDTDPFYDGRASPKTALEMAWVAFVVNDGDPQPLRAEIAASSSPIVFEWGFPVSEIWKVAVLEQLGIEGWWFDGDIATCHTAWRQVHSAAREFDWDRQVSSLKRSRPAIAAAYGPRIVRVIERGPVRLSHEQIASLMGLAI